MKKILFLTIALFLSACSQPVTSVYDTTEHEDKQIETMDREVNVYSLHQNGKGYIFKQEGRDKWLLTFASIVYEHPNPYIETSNKQLLKGKIVHLNVEENYAIIHFRNSAEIESSQLMVSIKLKDNLFDEDKLLKLQKESNKTEVSFDNRIAAKEYFKDVEQLKEIETPKISEYENYRPLLDVDELQLSTLKFVDLYNAYVISKDEQLFQLLANDEIVKLFKEWEVFGEDFAFGEVEVKQISQVQFQSVVSFETTIGSKNEKIKGNVIFIQMNGQWKVVSFNIEK